MILLAFSRIYSGFLSCRQWLFCPVRFRRAVFLASRGYMLHGEFLARLCVPQLSAVKNGGSCAFFCIRHTVRKKDQMQRSGDRVRISNGSRQAMPVIIVLAFWCWCATKQKQITPGTLTASSKKRRKITVTFYKLKNSGLFVEPRKIKGALLSAPGSMGKRCARGKIYVYNIHFCILLTAPALLVYTMGD